MPLSDMQYRDMLRKLRNEYKKLLKLLKEKKSDEVEGFLNDEIERISETLEDR